MSLRILPLAAALLLSFSAATLHGQQRAPAAKPNSGVVQVADDDREMNAAIDRARSTVPELLARLKNPPPGQEYLAVKVRLEAPDGGGEHMWLVDVRLEGGTLSGTLDNVPTMEVGYRRGDRIRGVRPAAITDWMTIGGGQMCGGFTIRVIAIRENPRSRIPPSQLCIRSAP